MNRRSAKVRLFVIAVLAPSVVLLAGTAVMLTWMPDLPLSVAVHWGIDGRPDEFGSAFLLPSLLLGLGIPAIALVGGILLRLERGRPFTPPLKLLAVTGLWVALVMTIAFAGWLAPQRGLVDGTAAPGPAVPLLWAFGVATVVAAIAWFLLPASVAPVASEEPPPAALTLATGERVAWIRRLLAPSGMVVLLTAVGVVVAAAAVVVILATGGRYWLIAIAPLVVVAIVGTTIAWRVRIDADGMVVRSVLGLPSITILIDDIEQAHVEDVDPMGQFGGWGLRWGGRGRSGIVLRAGSALAVRRRSGKTFLVTIDDAEAAAALLNALVARAAVHRPA